MARGGDALGRASQFNHINGIAVQVIDERLALFDIKCDHQVVQERSLPGPPLVRPFAVGLTNNYFRRGQCDFDVIFYI